MSGCEYTLEQVSRLDLEARILEANEDNRIHGVFIYFPVFGNQQDDYLRNLISFTKILRRAANIGYENSMLTIDWRWTATRRVKRLTLHSPCHRQGLVELSVYGDPSIKPDEQTTAGQTVTIFNRSEVIGRPLAVMMSNDGAEVLSFDEYGPLKFVAAKPEEFTISEARGACALRHCHHRRPIRRLSPIQAAEIQASSIGINFSSVPNFSDAAADKTSLFIPELAP